MHHSSLRAQFIFDEGRNQQEGDLKRGQDPHRMDRGVKIISNPKAENRLLERAYSAALYKRPAVFDPVNGPEQPAE